MFKTSASITVQYDNIFAPFPGSEWEAGFVWAKEQGFDAVELIVADPALLDAEQIAAAAQKLGLSISTISTGQAMGMEGLSMCVPSRAVRDATYRRLCEDIDFSVRLGRPNVTVGLIRGRGTEYPFETVYPLLLHEMRRVAAYADRARVTLNLEPINRYEVALVNSTAEGRTLLKDIGSPKNVGILYDTFHSNIEDEDMLSAIRENAGQISHVHLADSNRRLPGEGHTDFPAILKTLEQSAYSGYVSLEVLNRPDRAHIRACAGKQMRKIMEECKNA